MKKGFFRFSLAAVLFIVIIGCTQNQVTVVNRAPAHVIFCFRAKHYYLNPADSIMIKGLPYNEYTYGTLYGVPPGAKKSNAGKGLSSSLLFDADNTNFEVIYAGGIMDSTYNIDAIVTTNAPVIISPTTPEE
ncbi:MAG: hypothetical protein JW795_10380 [Chitinivibrionales bacterium]|nr:hypothetical protein [Chitinivibrionales bacterium]